MRSATLSITIVAVAVAVIVLVAVIAIIACGDDDAEVSAIPTVLDGDATIRISDFDFLPSNISIPAGATITWTNEDTAPHDATADSDAWETDTLDEDESESVTFEDPGTYTYHCSIHPYMTAQLIVRSP